MCFSVNVTCSPPLPLPLLDWAPVSPCVPLPQAVTAVAAAAHASAIPSPRRDRPSISSPPSRFPRPRTIGRTPADLQSGQRVRAYGTPTVFRRHVGVGRELGAGADAELGVD